MKERNIIYALRKGNFISPCLKCYQNIPLLQSTSAKNKIKMLLIVVENCIVQLYDHIAAIVDQEFINKEIKTWTYYIIYFQCKWRIKYYGPFSVYLDINNRSMCKCANTIVFMCALYLKKGDVRVGEVKKCRLKINLVDNGWRQFVTQEKLLYELRQGNVFSLIYFLYCWWWKLRSC